MWDMRLHVYLDDDVVARLDDRVGARGRSAYIEDAVRRALEQDRRWELIWSAVGSTGDDEHPWDPDPAGWVHEGRQQEAAARDERIRRALDPTP